MNERTFECQCGATRLVAEGSPITGVLCRCSHCIAANEAFRAMGAPALEDAQSGTRAILYRKDRVRLAAGAEHLEQFRLAPESPTRRVMARCCTSPIFLDYEEGFWLSVYRERTTASETEVRSRGPGLGFVAALMRTFVGLGFRRPAVDPLLAGLPERTFGSAGLAHAG